MIRLILRANRDERLRKRSISLIQTFGLYSRQVKRIEKKIRKSDKSNTKFIKKYLTKNNFPIVSKSGRKVADSAWLIVQHSNDIDLMKAVLEIMKTSSIRDQNPNNFALLTDRISINLGQPQIYGTQFDQDFNLFPIFEPHNLNERRRALGIESFEDYMVGAYKIYG